MISDYIRKRLERVGYQEVRTPIVLDRSLWEQSGHWDKFAENMFTLVAHERDYAIKPMNCPCHIQIFNQGLKSYRDLPLRLAEFGMCHRNEASGALHGIMRVINMTQDDGHIFCTEDQIQSEVVHFIDLLYSVYRDFGFAELEIKIATRPEKRVGSDEVWDKAENALKQALNSKDIPFQINAGDGAFYGPKIEFYLRDSIQRLWQCGTMQVDFSMPERLGATYIAESGEKKIPVMLHRAICGSLERFIGILIEHYAGVFPTWLAPIQVVVCNITDRQKAYVQKVTEVLLENGIRVQSDLRNEKVGFKIREHTLQKVPYLLVVGDREVETETVAIRSRSGEDLGTASVKQFIEQLHKEIFLLANKNIA